MLTKAYERLVIALVAMLPLVAAVYLYLFQTSAPPFEAHFFHEVAILIAIGQSSFIAFVTWRCYQSSGEPLLRWFALAFVGFSIIYAPHGAFTSLAHQHLWLFLLYGPVSRLVMAFCLLAGVLAYGQTAHCLADRARPGRWLPWLAGFLLIDLGVAVIALQWGDSPLMLGICRVLAELLGLPILTSPPQFVRLLAESGAIAFSLVGMVVILAGRPRSPLLLLTAIALAYSAQASLAFIFARIWEHLWWLAHLISAAGFTLLSYGVVRAYHTTRAFSLVFSQEEVMRRLAAAKGDAESLAERLEKANQNLEVLASIDPLTGLSNRRHFLEAAAIEVARARRSQTSFTVLAIDLDHFKAVNDHYGHAGGDSVLVSFAERVRAQLRPTDLVGRVGGEEFLVLLPGLDEDMAFDVAERIRLAIHNQTVAVGAQAIAVTVSIGIAEFSAHDDSLELVCQLADQRLYSAKNSGRNRCVGRGGATTV